jgi:hypothetical protein
MSYYDINKEILIAYQSHYYRENRDRYLEYMRAYNRQYYLKRKSEKPPRVPKEKKQRVPKEKKQRVPKQKKQKEIVKEIVPTVVENIVILPTRIYRGNFTLSFD